MRIKRIVPLRAGALAAILLAVGGCAHVAVEGGEKPIHLVVDVNIKVDRQLDQFFAFEDRYKGAATQPAPATQALAQPKPN